MDCSKNFELILRTSPRKGLENAKSKSGIACSHCGSKTVRQLVSAFKVGGRGDLRESTEYHGCHPFDGLDHPGHDHDHEHD